MAALQPFEGRSPELYLTRLDFVILDELGYLPFAQAGGQLLFPHGDIVSTPERFCSGWPE
jgi:hypothetical protein